MDERPMPIIGPINQPYWAAANQGRLCLQRCQSPDCGKFVFYPRVCCPHCGGGTLHWTEVSGHGKILTYTYIHRPQHPSFQPEVPICFIAVRLDEGPVVYSRLSQPLAPEKSLIGRTVRTTFAAPMRGQCLPLFELTAN